MNKTIMLLVTLILVNVTYGQTKSGGLKMISDYSSDNPEIRDILRFEGIEYLKIKFTGIELKGKT